MFKNKSLFNYSSFEEKLKNKLLIFVRLNNGCQWHIVKIKLERLYKFQAPLRSIYGNRLLSASSRNL